MPRRATPKPVAFASTVVSIDSLVASANDVTFLTSWSFFARKSALRVRRAVVVDHALDVAGRDRAQADRLDVAEQGHRDARLVAVGVRQHDAGFVGLGLQYRADQRVELRVHQHHGLAVLERVEHHARAEIDGARHFDDQVDRVAARQHGRVVGEHRHAARDSRCGFARRVCRLPFANAGLPERTFGVLRACDWPSPASRMPGTGVPSCSAIARPVAPAPTTPTRIGRCSASRICSTL